MSRISTPVGNVYLSRARPLTLFDVARRTILLLILIRASLDNLLNAIESAVGVPIGALLNVTVIASAIVIFSANPDRRRLNLGIFWPLLFLVCAASIANTPDKIAAFRFLAVLATFCALFIVPAVLVRHERDVVPSLKVILLSSIAPILVGFANFGAERAQSTFPHPNILAFYLASIIITIALVWLSKLFTLNMSERALLVCLSGLCGIMLVLTQTRAAWVALALTFGVIAVLYDRRLLLGVLAMPLLLLVPQIQERFLDLKETTEYIGEGMIANSYEWRLMLWESAFTWIKRDPIFGYGLFSFQMYSPKFFHWDMNGFNAHSVYVQLLFETGLFGLVFFVMIFATVAFTAFRCWRNAPEAAAFIFALCVFYLTICYSDNIMFYLSFNWYFWLLLGTLRAWLLLPKNPQHQGIAGLAIPPARS